MQVDLEFVEDNTTFEIAEIRAALAKYAKAEDDRNRLSDTELIAQIKKRLKQTDQKRVKEVIYDVTVYLQNGESINQEFEITEQDLLFGTK